MPCNHRGLLLAWPGSELTSISKGTQILAAWTWNYSFCRSIRTCCDFHPVTLQCILKLLWTVWQLLEISVSLSKPNELHLLAEFAGGLASSDSCRARHSVCSMILEHVLLMVSNVCSWVAQSIWNSQLLNQKWIKKTNVPGCTCSALPT